MTSAKNRDRTFRTYNLLSNYSRSFLRDELTQKLLVLEEHNATSVQISVDIRV